MKREKKAEPVLGLSDKSLEKWMYDESLERHSAVMRVHEDLLYNLKVQLDEHPELVDPPTEREKLLLLVVAEAIVRERL